MICPELENRLRSMGLTSRYQGYACLVQAVLLIRADPAMLDMPAKLLYPRLARLTGLSAGDVDRAIRTAIQVCCRRTHPQRSGDELPTVRQFLAALADGSGGSL